MQSLSGMALKNASSRLLDVSGLLTFQIHWTQSINMFDHLFIIVTVFQYNNQKSLLAELIGSNIVIILYFKKT